MAIRLSDHFSYKRLLKFVFPSIVMMIFTSIYGVVDGFFVSNFAGKTSFAALNLIYPVVMILGGVGFMIGSGGSALVAMTLGQKKEEEANRYFAMMVELTIIAGITLGLIAYLLMPQIAYFFKARGQMHDDCVTYGRISVIFIFSFMLQNLFQSFLITAEKPKYGLYFTIAAGVTNIIGDFLLVGVFKFGITGAALATGLSQLVGGVLPIFYFISPLNNSRLKLVPTSLELDPIIKACSNGFSELLSNISSSIVSIIYNNQLITLFGENGVSVYGVLMYVQFVFIAIFIGYAVGSAPIAGYHYGALNNDELKNVLKKSMKLMAFAGILMAIIAYSIAIPVVKIFVGYDEELMNMTLKAFYLYIPTFILAGMNIYASSFFTALNNGKVSAIISALRTLVFQTSCVLLIPIIIGPNGIWMSNAISETFSFITVVYALLKYRHVYHYM